MCKCKYIYLYLYLFYLANKTNTKFSSGSLFVPTAAKSDCKGSTGFSGLFSMAV